jgi:hypothetical protein
MESPGRWPYGPNTPAVRRFLQRFAALDAGQWDAAAAAFEAAERTPAYTAADRALAAAITRADRARERDAVIGPLLQIARPAGGAPDPHPVAAAALAAVLALLARDALDDHTFAVLYAPFADLVPVPTLGDGGARQ